MPNTGKVYATIRNVRGRIVHDKVQFVFVNQRVRAYNRRAVVTFSGRPIPPISGVPSGPHGLYQVFIKPEKYRPKSIFLPLFRRTAKIDEILFIDPDHVKASFPKYSSLKSGKTKRLAEVLKRSGYTAKKYNQLADLPKAGLFNLFSKMESTILPNQSTVFTHVSKITKVKPARIFAKVSEDLIECVKNDREWFHVVPATLHEAPKGWEHVKDGPGSFKTSDRAGNLQLTFFENQKGDYMVDADIDDHQGIEHAFDVIKHKVTKKDTHPYDIHQILIFFQGIDLGYELA